MLDSNKYDAYNRLMLLYEQQVTGNTQLRNKIIDLIKEREQLINEIERLRCEQVYTGHRN